MSSDLLNIALSGVNANRIRLGVTGQNISNANVEGYSRQDVRLATRPSQLQGGFFLGNGVSVAELQRASDDFTVAQLHADTARHHETDAYRQRLEALDAVLSSDTMGLGGHLDRFFQSLQAAADDPTSTVAREVVLAELTTLTERFSALQARMDSERAAVNTQLTYSAAQVTELASAVADANRAIAERTSAQGTPPAELLDQRDQLIRDLSRYVEVQTVKQSDGSVNLYVQKGLALVVGGTANPIDAAKHPLDRDTQALYLTVNGHRELLNGSKLGGEVGGLSRYLEDGLQPAQNELGRVALGLADAMNRQHALGMDRNGIGGGLLFSDPNSTYATTHRAFPAEGNVGPADRNIAVSIIDSQRLVASDYRLELTASSNYALIRLQDGAQVAAGPMTGVPLTFAVDGLEIELTSGSFQSGDQFLISPFRTAAADLEPAIAAPADLALAQPVRGEAVLANLGSAVIEVAAVNSRTAFDASGSGALPLEIQFASPPTSYAVTDGGGGVVATGLAYPPPAGSNLLPSQLG